MRKILAFACIHLGLFMLGGLALGLSALGVGFSDSVQVHNIYNVLLVVWEIFNAPAGVYILHVKEPNWLLWGGMQLFSSFLWASLAAFTLSKWKMHRHSIVQAGCAKAPPLT